MPIKKIKESFPPSSKEPSEKIEKVLSALAVLELPEVAELLWWIHKRFGFIITARVEEKLP